MNPIVLPDKYNQLFHIRGNASCQIGLASLLRSKESNICKDVVIKIAGHGDSKRFTVRKMSGTVGVERIFPMGSPNIASVTVEKVGKVRRAKLYYLRDLTGKKARIKEKKFITKEA